MTNPFADGKENVEHLETCTRENCQRCDHLTEFYMCCDTCGSVGHMDSDGWFLHNGIPYCNATCAGATAQNKETDA